jgi:TorA maturation chaperone TorD
MDGIERSEVGTDWKKAADNAQLRSNIYGLLSTVFREEPTEALIHELRGPRLSGIFSDMGVELGETFSNISDSAVAEALGLEFTRLFIGPGPHVSAHESVFAEMDGGTSSLWGRKTVEVKNFIETAGLGYQPEYSGIPDHVSVELEFMQKLTAWEAEKWTQQDRKSAEYCSTVQRLFLNQHLLCWLPQFCDAVMEQAELPFYRSMSELTRNYLEFER